MNKTIIKNRFFYLLVAFVMAICTIPYITVSAETYPQGGYCRVVKHAYVYRIDKPKEQAGEIWPGEGVTVLEALPGGKMHIEFNTPNGPERGKVDASALDLGGIVFHSAYGEINHTCTTYYAPDTLIYAGSVNYGESVAVLCVSNGWAYIEYNVTSANGYRKRAYIPSRYVDTSSTRYENQFYQDLYDASDFTVTNTKTVYAGPNDVSYEPIGFVYPSDNGNMKKYVNSSNRFFNADGHEMYYISYPDANNNKKYGYVLA